MAQLCSRYLEKKLLAFQKSEVGWRSGYRSDDEKYGFLPTPFKRKRKRHLQSGVSKQTSNAVAEKVNGANLKLNTAGLRDITNMNQGMHRDKSMPREEPRGGHHDSTLNNASGATSRIRRPSYKRSLTQEFEMAESRDVQNPIQSVDIVNSYVSTVGANVQVRSSLKEIYQSSTESYQSTSISGQSSGSFYVSRGDSCQSCQSGCQSCQNGCQTKQNVCQPIHDNFQLLRDVNTSYMNRCQSNRNRCQSNKNRYQSSGNNCQSNECSCQSCRDSCQSSEQWQSLDDNCKSNAYPRTLNDVQIALKEATLGSPANIVMFVTKQQTLTDTNGSMLQYKAHTGMLVSALYAHTDEQTCVRLPNGLTGLLSRDVLLPLGVKVSRDFTQQFPDGSSLETTTENEYVNGKWVDEWLRNANDADVSLNSESIWDSSFYSDGTFVTTSSTDLEVTHAPLQDTRQRPEKCTNTETQTLNGIQGINQDTYLNDVQLNNDNGERKALLDYLELMENNTSQYHNQCTNPSKAGHANAPINRYETPISNSKRTSEYLHKQCQSMNKVSPRFASINRLERSPSSTSVMTRDTESSGYSSSLGSVTRTDVSTVTMVTELDMCTVNDPKLSTVGVNESNIVSKYQFMVTDDQKMSKCFKKQNYVSTVNGNVMTVVNVDPVTVNTCYAKTMNDDDPGTAGDDCDSAIQEPNVRQIKLSDITYRPPLNRKNQSETDTMYANLPDITQLLKHCHISQESPVVRSKGKNEPVPDYKNNSAGSSKLTTSSPAVSSPMRSPIYSNCITDPDDSGNILSPIKDTDKHYEEHTTREDTSLITRCGSFNNLCMSSDCAMCCPCHVTALDPGSSSRDTSDPCIDQLSSIQAPSSSLVTSCNTSITSPDSMTSAILQFTSSHKMSSQRNISDKNRKSKHYRTSTVKSYHEHACSKSHRKSTRKQQFTPPKKIDLLKTIESIETTDSGNWSEVSTDIDDTPEEKHQPRLTAVFDYVTTSTHDVSLRKQDVVTLLNDENSDWLWVRKENGEVGYIPKTYVVNLEKLNLDPHTKTTYL